MSDDLAKGLAMIGQLFIRFCDVQNGRVARLRSGEPGLSNVIKEVEVDLQKWQEKYPKEKAPPKSREEINRARREKRAADKVSALQVASSKITEQAASQLTTDDDLPSQEPAPVQEEPVNESKEKKRKRKHGEKSRSNETDEERKQRKIEKKARKKREKELAAAST